MVTVHHAFGFRFVMFVNDHDPPHVHVFGQGGEAKIDLLANGTAVLAWVRGVSRGSAAVGGGSALAPCDLVA